MQCNGECYTTFPLRLLLLGMSHFKMECVMVPLISSNCKNKLYTPFKKLTLLKLNNKTDNLIYNKNILKTSHRPVTQQLLRYFLHTTIHRPIIFVIQRNNTMLLTERPPPSEPGQSGKNKLRISSSTQFFHKIQNRWQ